MKEKWTGDVVGKMHVYEITFAELGKEMGVTKAYVSMLLNGIKKPKGTRQRVESALQNIIERKKGETVETVNGKHD